MCVCVGKSTWPSALLEVDVRAGFCVCTVASFMHKLIVKCFSFSELTFKFFTCSPEFRKKSKARQATDRQQATTANFAAKFYS